MRYASGPALIEAPAHVAHDKDFFNQSGLKVQMDILPDGKMALSKLLEGKYDLAGVMATPVVIQSFQRSDFRIVAVIEHPKFHHLLVNKDRVISPEDLAGKRVGVTKGTSGEYYMHSFLLNNEIPFDKIEFENLHGPQLVDAFVDGEVDAIFSWHPYIYKAQTKTETKTAIFNEAQIVHPSWMMVANQHFVEHNPGVIKSFLSGLSRGVDYANKNPEELIQIHQKVSRNDKPYLHSRKVKGQFQLTLQQELLLDLEKKARWIMAKDSMKEKEMPNYLDFIYLDAMQAVSSETVTVVK